MLLDSFGIPRERVLLEGRSRDTYENALLTKAMVHPKPEEKWLLVTSAQHMPRAIGSFRRVGFQVEAYPVDWRTFPKWDISIPYQVSERMALTDEAAHEWLGLLAYRLSGRIS